MKATPSVLPDTTQIFQICVKASPDAIWRRSPTQVDGLAMTRCGQWSNMIGSPWLSRPLASMVQVPPRGVPPL
jgi:hypothetical protein